jgi:hypothetical protein
MAMRKFGVFDFSLDWFYVLTPVFIFAFFKE